MSRKSNGEGYYHINDDVYTCYDSVRNAKLHMRERGVRYKLYRSQVLYGEYWRDEKTNRLVGVKYS